MIILQNLHKMSYHVRRFMPFKSNDQVMDTYISDIFYCNLPKLCTEVQLVMEILFPIRVSNFVLQTFSSDKMFFRQVQTRWCKMTPYLFYTKQTRFDVQLIAKFYEFKNFQDTFLKLNDFISIYQKQFKFEFHVCYSFVQKKRNH